MVQVDHKGDRLGQGASLSNCDAMSPARYIKVDTALYLNTNKVTVPVNRQEGEAAERSLRIDGNTYMIVDLVGRNCQFLYHSKLPFTWTPDILPVWAKRRPYLKL